MKTCIICHSYSGVTRSVARQIQAACGGELIEVRSCWNYNQVTVYPVGGMRAWRGDRDPIDPETIDISACDLLVIGSPVWAYRPTPAINAAIAGLNGGSGKRAVIFATCGSKAGETLAVMRRALGEKGISVIGEAVLTRREINRGDRIQELIGLVKEAGIPAP